MGDTRDAKTYVSAAICFNVLFFCPVEIVYLETGELW